MLNRRKLFLQAGLLPAALGLAAALPGALVPPAWASPAGDHASAFVKVTGEKLVATIDAPGTPEQRRVALGAILDSAVDIDGVARFCLGRFLRTATPDQQREYLKLFREVLVTNISAKMGEYKGVKFTVGTTKDKDAGEEVSTVVERPNNPPANVQWVVANSDSAPKIIDVIAEGTSLRITQRDDYASFLSQHANSVAALIDAMRKQVTQAP